MKKILLILLVCFSYSNVTSQQINVEDRSPTELHKIYTKKRNTNNIVGWSMLGTGIGIATIGFTTNMSQGWGEGNTNKGIWLIYAGGATSLASIPFFIAANKNKRKARLELKKEIVLYDNGSRNYTALCVKIEF